MAERPPGETLFLGNLDSAVTSNLLHDICIQAGPVERTHVATDDKGQSKNFGFVKFSSLLYGRPVRVGFAKERSADADAELAKKEVQDVLRNAEYMQSEEQRELSKKRMEQAMAEHAAYQQHYQQQTHYQTSIDYGGVQGGHPTDGLYRQQSYPGAQPAHGIAAAAPQFQQQTQFYQQQQQPVQHQYAGYDNNMATYYAPQQQYVVQAPAHQRQQQQQQQQFAQGFVQQQAQQQYYQGQQQYVQMYGVQQYDRSQQMYYTQQYYQGYQ